MSSILFKQFIKRSILSKQPAPPTGPPRPGLVWKPQTHRWIRPKDRTQAGGQDSAKYIAQLRDKHGAKFPLTTTGYAGERPIVDHLRVVEEAQKAGLDSNHIDIVRRTLGALHDGDTFSESFVRAFDGEDSTEEDKQKIVQYLNDRYDIKIPKRAVNSIPIKDTDSQDTISEGSAEPEIDWEAQSKIADEMARQRRIR